MERKRNKNIGKDSRIFIRISNKLKEDISKLSKKLKIGLSEFVRIAVEEKIKKEKENGRN